MIGVLLHGRLCQDGTELLQRVLSRFDTQLGRMGVLLDEQCRLTTLHGSVKVGAIRLEREDEK